MIIGIDPSLTATALHSSNGASITIGSKPTEDTAKSRIFRYGKMIQQADAFLEQFRCEAIFIEHYSYGSRGRNEYLGEYGGMLRKMLLSHTKQVIEVAPTALKKFVTGKGVGKKELIIAEVYRRWDFFAKSSDEADAFALCMLGQVALGKAKPQTKIQKQVARESLKK